MTTLIGTSKLLAKFCGNLNNIYYLSQTNNFHLKNLIDSSIELAKSLDLKG